MTSRKFSFRQNLEFGDVEMLYMAIERFKNRDAIPVYRRFREKGCMTPNGLNYVDSWVETNFDRCFQLMECEDAQLLDKWAAQWNDLVEFEFVPVRASKEAVAFLAPELRITRCQEVLHPAKAANQGREFGPVLLGKRCEFPS